MTMKKAKIAVLVSGGGTNLQALLDAQAAGLLPHGEIALVVSSNAGRLRPGAGRPTPAFPAETVSRKRCGGQAAFESALSDLLAAHEIDLIVLAGFLTILSAGLYRPLALPHPECPSLSDPRLLRQGRCTV